MALIRNNFHKEVGLMWDCLWWARKEASSQYPHQVVLGNFPGPWLPTHSLVHAYSLSLLFSAFSLILLEAGYLSLVVTFEISLA